MHNGFAMELRRAAEVAEDDVPGIEVCTAARLAPPRYHGAGRLRLICAGLSFPGAHAMDVSIIQLVREALRDG